MNLKKKLAMGIATGALAVSMIGGGTYAYFSTTKESTNNHFTAGTMNINIEGFNHESAIINIGDIKPGDTMERTFRVHNTGTIDISKILLSTDYSVGNDWDNTINGHYYNFAEYINVYFWNEDWNNWSAPMTLSNLKAGYLPHGFESFKGNIGANGGWKDYKVKFEFIDNNENQNYFQGDSLQLTWKFDARQTAGEAK